MQRMGWEPNKPFVMQWAKIREDGPGLHMPKRLGDVGYDLEAAEEMVLYPGQQRDVATNVRVQLPIGCWGEIRARSSIARRGLQVDAGVIDNGYNGELLVLIRNMKMEIEGPEFIARGERIGQLILHVMAQPDVIEVEEMLDDPRRGVAGFGSTGR